MERLRSYFDTELGVWVQVAMTPEEEAALDAEFEISLAAEARATRDQLLAACDKTQLPDAPLTAAAKRAWAEYREELRDIPDQEGFPYTVVWPEVPAVSSDSDLASASNMAVIMQISEKDALDEINQLVERMEEGIAKETLEKLITILGE